ncbi:hypothetical protein M9Y10_037871 [Tritrichomonas musculus]|uniref:Ras-GEF domain-containing protein n=1 Tax=Tritrichomonas musculus TaxID=1915356 RepID=A0ABR2K6V4_9EUKA
MSKENEKSEEITPEERSLWLYRAMEEDTTSLELRERTFPWTKVHSYGLLKRANYTSCSAQLDRYRVLEIIYQHLHSIGMHHVAYSLAQESQLEFQRKDQDMERTDLRLLVSMSLGPRDNLWDDTGIENTVLAEEPFDEDNESVRYVEPIEKISEVLKGDFSCVEFKKGEENTFSGIKFAPLRYLIIALLKGKPIESSIEDHEKFFLTLNSICSSSHFFNHLSCIYEQSDNDMKEKVLDLLIEWVHFSGLFIGKKTLRDIRIFVQDIDDPKALDLYNDIPNLSYGRPIIKDEKPLPEIKNPESLLVPNLTLDIPQAVEVARQISLVCHSLFNVIHPREFYFAISKRRLCLDTKRLCEFFQFGNKIKLLVAYNILANCNKSNQFDTKVFKKMIRIANKLLEINNFEAVSWFVSAFKMKCIMNLNQLWNFSNEEQETLQNLTSNYDWRKQSDSYAENIEKCYDQKIPAIPNMRYELSLVAVDGYGGEEFKKDKKVGSKVNWEKRNVSANSIRFYNQFQDIKYNFHKISQIQNLLSEGLVHTKEELNSLSMQIKKSAIDANVIKE